MEILSTLMLRALSSPVPLPVPPLSVGSNGFARCSS